MFDYIPNFTDGPSQGALAERGFQTGEPVEIEVDFKLTGLNLSAPINLEGPLPSRRRPCLAGDLPKSDETGGDDWFWSLEPSPPVN